MKYPKEYKLKILNIDIEGFSPVPKRATAHAAAYDLKASEACDIPPRATRIIRTDIKIAIPNGYVGYICSRSGLANNGVFVINAPGVIDADYRGEIKVLLHNNDITAYHINAGDRVAQLLFHRAYEANFVEQMELDETDRGEGGIGSTGV